MISESSIYRLCGRRRANCSHDADLRIFSSTVRGKLYSRFHRSLVTASADVDSSVFNLEFSPDDRYLVAVLAAYSFEMWDPRTCKRIRTRRAAHDDCVNCVTFISDRQFATCSDDCTIRLWDPRNLGPPLATLRGHQNWVKNIEYDAASGLLFSVAFQDGVRYWDLNDLGAYGDDEEDRENLIPGPSDPVRMRLSPDGSKMVVTSRNNQCFVISDFDGWKLLEVSDLYREFWSELKSPNVHEKLRNLSHNRPSVHTLCGKQGRRKRRIVMSAAFHPSGDFIAMRHTDVGSGEVQQELTSLYDLRQEPYTPLVTAELSQHNYLRYVDDNSPKQSSDYIKEICFSSDGRVIGSPHEDGVRFLAVDHHCTPPDQYFDSRYHSVDKEYCCPDFEQVACLPNIHPWPVLPCKFAHNDLIIASGSLSGSVAFTTPQL